MSVFERKKAKKQLEAPEHEKHLFKRASIFVGFKKIEHGRGKQRHSLPLCSSVGTAVIAKLELVHHLYNYGFRVDRVQPRVILKSFPSSSPAPSPPSDSVSVDPDNPILVLSHEPVDKQCSVSISRKLFIVR